MLQENFWGCALIAILKRGLNWSMMLCNQSLCYNFTSNDFQVEEEMLMRKFYELMTAQGLNKKVCLSREMNYYPGLVVFTWLLFPVLLEELLISICNCSTWNRDKKHIFCFILICSFFLFIYVTGRFYSSEFIFRDNE